MASKEVYGERLAAALWRLAFLDAPGEEKFSRELISAINGYLDVGGKLVEVAKMFEVTIKRLKQELKGNHGKSNHA